MRSDKKIIILFLAFCTSLMLCMEFVVKCEENEFQDVFLGGGICNLKTSLSGKTVLASLILYTVYQLGCKLREVYLPKDIWFKIFSVILAGIWLMAECFRIDNRLYHAVESFGQIIKSGIYLTGASYFIYLLCQLLFSVLEYGKDIQVSPGKFLFLKQEYKMYQMRFCVLFLLLCWSGPILISFPANIGNDAWSQLIQFWRNYFIDHHPPTSTIIYGFFTWIGKKMFGSVNIGIFLFIVSQTLIYALVISYAVRLMKKLHAPNWLMICYLFTAGFTPYYANYVSLVLKDSLYSIMLLLFMIEFMHAIIDYHSFLNSRMHIVLTICSTAGIILIRKNGRHILYPTLFIVVIILLFLWKKLKKQIAFRGILLLISAVALANAVEFGLEKHLDVQKGSIREALSLPFQQTARYVLCFPDEVTEIEKEAIDAVLDYESLAKNYTPWISDPVKQTFREKATEEELKRYFRVWMQMFFKHPVTYAAATLNQNYFLFYPFIENPSVITSYGSSHEDVYISMSEDFGFTEFEIFKEERKVLKEWYCLLCSLPVIGLLSHPAVYTFILLFLLIYALANRKYRLLLPCVPAFMTFLVIILAPAVQTQARYAFPIIYSVPLLIAYGIYLRRETE